MDGDKGKQSFLSLQNNIFSVTDAVGFSLLNYMVNFYLTPNQKISTVLLMLFYAAINAWIVNAIISVWVKQE